MLSSPPPTRFLLDFCLSSFLTQIVKQPTRGDNILDLIFVNDTSFIENAEVFHEIPGSDHKSVFSSLQFLTPDSIQSRVRDVPAPYKLDLRRADWDRYRSLLHDFLLHIDFSDSCPDKIWTSIKSSILKAAGESIPLHRVQRQCQGVSFNRFCSKSIS